MKISLKKELWLHSNKVVAVFLVIPEHENKQKANL